MFMSRSPRVTRAIASLTAAVMLTTTVAGCADAPTAPAPAPVAPQAGLIGGLLGVVTGTVTTVVGTVGGLLGFVVCEQPYQYYAQKRIGRYGGTITVGNHSLVIPYGALDSTVTITAIAPKGNNVAVQFYPHGLQFKRPATVTMSYQRCGVKYGAQTQVVYVSDEGTPLEILPSITDTRYERVVGSMDHFSSYMVAFRSTTTSKEASATEGSTIE